MMRAAVLERLGGPEALVYKEVADPVAGPGQVLVRVRFAAVCGFDTLVRRGLPGYNVGSGVILGHEFAGEIVAVGEGVQDFTVGDRVTALPAGYCGSCALCLSGQQAACAAHHELSYGSSTWPGGYAEFCAADTSTVIKVPDEVTWEAAAVAACPIGVALHALKRAKIRIGERVVVTGAGGGVGVHAVQLAHAAGCEVIAVTSSAQKVAQLEKFADHVVVLTDDRFLDDGLRADVVVETTAGITLPKSLRAVRRGGRIVVAGMVGTEAVPFSPGPFFVRELTMIGSNSTNHEDVAEVLSLIARQEIEPVFGDVVPLADIRRAHQMVEDRATLGRVLLDMAM